MSRSLMIAKAIQSKMGKKPEVENEKLHPAHEPDSSGHARMIKAIMEKRMCDGGMYADGGEVQSKVFSGTPEEQETKRKEWADRWGSMAKGVTGNSSAPAQHKASDDSEGFMAKAGKTLGFADCVTVDDPLDASDDDMEWIQIQHGREVQVR